MILVRIQHHPSRAALIPPLLEALAPLEVEVSAHASDPPSPWAGYKRCLQELPDRGHVLVLQDDALPVPGFVPALLQIAQAQPSTPVGLFLSSLPSGTASYARRAHARGQRYARVYPNSNVVHTVAVLWPVEKAREFMAWTENVAFLKERADDGILAKWVRRTGQPFLVTVPSIVEHGDVPTTKGSSNVQGLKALFVADDASNYSW